MTPNLLNITPELSASVATKSAAVRALLADIAGRYTPVAFANSLGAEDTQRQYDSDGADQA